MCVEDIYRCPEFIKVPACASKIRRPVSWSPPGPSVFKFNIDGSAIGQPGLAGIGGIPRDSRLVWLVD